ncbi:MAG: CoA pyrophosphatase [Longimicrobiales bacterium]|nr:CoA pyrophosphatase [Longimicrobiales bacterium]
MIDLDTLAERLALPRESGPATDAPPLGTEGLLHAAVSVVARPAADGPELLLIKRAVIEGDPWSGHMAFPGGKHEAGDRHLLETAVRETREETGLALPDRPPEWIGRLPGVAPRGPNPLPPLVVTPFLFRVGAEARARVASPEIERVQWVALAELADPARRSELRLRVGDGPAIQRFPAIELGDEKIWGLTWRVLDALLRRLR